MVVIAAITCLACWSCTDERHAMSAPDSVDGILDILSNAPSQAALPASTDPTITINQPTHMQKFQLQVPVTPVTVSFSITNWDTYPAAGKSVQCLLDGVVDGSIASGTEYTFSDVPMGWHQLCCGLMNGVTQEPYCESLDCVDIRVVQPCLGANDNVTCDDGDPRSVDACNSIGDGQFECNYGPAPGDKCVSPYDCDCSGDFTLEQCDPDDSTCKPCLVDAHCDDNEKCTVDSCNVDGSCSNDWTENAEGQKCCHTGMADPDSACNDGDYCTVDYCDLGAEHCVNEDAGLPDCCGTDPDPKCDDGNVCTVDKCISHECRHGPVSDPLCCNTDNDCDDSNVCTDDTCGVGNTCVFTDNDMPNCCTIHPDCGPPNGEWDDGQPETIDFCQNNQCMHVLNPTWCDEVEYPCLPDDDICTEDECDLDTNTCYHLPIAKCCEVVQDCNDAKVCTTDKCEPVDGQDYDECDHSLIDGCCMEDIECEDENPCNLDRCINHVCRHGPNEDLDDCCQTDEDCEDNIDCTLEYCDLDASTCVKTLNPNPPEGEECCYSAAGCDDSNPYTEDTCVNNECVHGSTGVCLPPDVLCNDNNVCTTDSCEDVDPQTGEGTCAYTTINDCCLIDDECGEGDLTDDNPCTTDTCDLTVHQCVFTPITECCSSSADCGPGGDNDDGDDCTIDTCVNFSCKHVKEFAGCCTSSSQCDDNNTCTIDQCNTDTNVCEHAVNLNDDGCCASATDCYDADVCTLDKCVNYQCGNDPIEGCCTDDPTPFDPICDDDNICTCDMCIYGICRNLGPDQAPPSCDLSPLCCTQTSDCDQPTDPCQSVTCNVDTYLCEYSDVGLCALALPYTQNFNSCATLTSLGWQVVDLGADAEGNWKCTSLGPLGADNHERFDWAPQVAALFDSYLVTPAFQAEGLSAVTVQYDRYYNHFEETVDLGLYVVSDANADDTLDGADTFVPLWLTSATEGFDAETVTYQVPAPYLDDTLRIGFKVGSTNSYNLNHFDLDNVKVCPGVAPTWDDHPSLISVAWNSNSLDKITASDADDDDLTFSLVSAPAFVSLQNPAKSWVFENWSVKLVVEPTSDQDIGEHDIVVRVSDGCIDKDVVIPLTVVVSDGYVVWQPSGAPSAHATAIKDAIAANGRTVQLVDDLTVFSSLDDIKGVFVVLGIYGSKHVLTEAEVESLINYLDGGGKVYMEGGDTWAFDTWTNIHPYFMVEPVDDGEQTYPGPVDGKHFCYQHNYNVGLDYTVNNFIDQIDKKVNSGGIPILKDSADDDFSLAVAYEDPTTVYRTVGASLPFAALVEKGEGTLNEYMLLIILFFEDGFPPCELDLQCFDSIQCTNDTCEAGACVNVDVPDCTVCVDDQDCAFAEACNLNNNICVDIPGSDYSATDVPVNISQISTGTYTSTITVPDTDSVQDVNVKIQIQHAYRGDLKIELSHAGINPPVVLKQADPTDSEANLYWTYDKGTDVWTGSVNDLSDFDGTGMNGDWTLTITDTAALSGGKLLGWTVFIVHDTQECSGNATCEAAATICSVGTCSDENYCVYTEKDCSDDTECTADSCVEPGGCQNIMKDCDDGNVCTNDDCDPVTGDCLNVTVDYCTAPCVTHADCGLHDYCDPVESECKPIPGTAYMSATAFPVAIPDNEPIDVVDTIVIGDDVEGYIQEANVKVLATHPFKGDLTITLSNGSKTIYLHKQTGGAADNVYAVYDIVEGTDDTSDMSAYHDMFVKGTWTLTVHDWVTGDSGTLDQFSLYFESTVCINDVQCDDADACTVDKCDLTVPGGECLHTDIECDDGAWCNGTETCDQVMGCLAGIPPTIDDGVVCTADFCDEVLQEVTHTAQDLLCDDDLYCNGTETCDPVDGCIAGTPPAVDDGQDCTTDTCDEDGDVVQNIPDHTLCTDGLWCNGAEVCDPDQGCVDGTPPDLSDGVGCTIDLCDEPTDTVQHQVSHDLCDDNLWCNGQEVCDEVQDCLAGTPVDVDDGVGCTDDVCDEDSLSIIHTPSDSFCDDGLWCNGSDTCDIEVGCEAGTPPILTDNIACTVDECDEDTQAITHTPDHAACDDSNLCTDDVCHDVLGCVIANNSAACDDGELCTLGDYCEEGSCLPGPDPNADDPACNNCIETGCPFDGNLCNGEMVCNIETKLCELVPNSVVICADHPSPCLDNVCDPNTGECGEEPRDAGWPCDDGDICTVDDKCDGAGVCAGSNSCNDGFFCNGEETCDPDTGDCLAGVPPIKDDFIGCTLDTCDEVNDVIDHAPNHEYCSDGTFCNGEEVCDEGLGCLPGTPVETDDGIPCTEDSCDEDLDAVLHTPNDATCDDGEYCNGAEQCSTLEGCVAGDLPDLSDGVACTLDECDEAADAAIHTADHASCSDGDDCNGIEYCDVNTGCQAGTPPEVDDGIACTLDSCVDGELQHLADNSVCDDGLWCNGNETCSTEAGCTSGGSPETDDGVECTVDYCHEDLDMVVHQPDHPACDNGAFCDGAEVCDPVAGCQDGTPPTCDDSNTCTLDSCDPALNQGAGACDNSDKVQYCDSVCGGSHAYDAGDDDCGYDDACVGGTAGEGLGNCTPICNKDYCAKGDSGLINAPVNDGVCVTKTVFLDAPHPYVTNVNLKAEVQHSKIGDLRLYLKDPDGTEVQIWDHDHTNGLANFSNTYTLSLPDIVGDFCDFQGHSAGGTWTFKVCDDYDLNVGILKQWKLYVETSESNMSSGDTCEAPITLDSADGTSVLAGSTNCAAALYSSSCGGAAGVDRVYSFSIAAATKVEFDLDSTFDAITYLKGSDAGTCSSVTLTCKDDCVGDACNETFSKRLYDAGTYYYFVDGASGADKGSYDVTVTFTQLLENGEECGESDECISNYCANGYCCDGPGDCCAIGANCPLSYTSAPQCDDIATCAGHRVDATCDNFICGSAQVDDDSGCEGEHAHECGCYLPLICTDDVEQPLPTCPVDCVDEVNDAECDAECHCDPVGCEADYPDGEACDEDSDCISSYCADNGFCCTLIGDESSCCSTADDCPDEGFVVPPTCDNWTECQGHRDDKGCANSICVADTIEDDTACDASQEANDCGWYLGIYCDGTLDQLAPSCPTDCLDNLDQDDDTQCDPDAHCDTICLEDLPNGEACDEASDCVSDWCNNGYCCDPGGVCCNEAASCPIEYTAEPECDNSVTCQGHKVAATCINSVCGSANANDDSACFDGMLADECGLYKSLLCTGEVDQPVPECPASCLDDQGADDDSQCDEIAHCDGICELDYPNGTVCDELSDCMSSHCQNGFCCDDGDCCIVADNCPESYYVPPACDSPESCQGARFDKRCDVFMCNNEPIDDDSGCTAQTLSEGCSCYPSVYCNGEQEQSDPPCAIACVDEVNNSDCDENCHCDGTCEADLENGMACDENSDCISDQCVDGVCCDTVCDKPCEACDSDGFVGTCTPHDIDTDPEDDCGLCTLCNGASACAIVPNGADPINECPQQSESTCLKDGWCDGAGNCRLWALGVECVPQSCMGVTMYPSDHCDGVGMCIDSGSVSCVPYVCDAEQFDCLTACTGDQDCSSGFWCDTEGQCVPKKDNGQVCGPELNFNADGDGGNQCISDACSDGYCCNVGCQEDCRACDYVGKEGTCTFHSPLSDPEDDCPVCTVCDGIGNCGIVTEGEDPVDDCDITEQSECDLDGTCDGAAACRYWLPGTICVEQWCVPENDGMGDYQVNADTCDGAGECVDNEFTGCYPYICNGDWGCYENCMTDAECAPDSWCKGTECVEKKDNGEPCSSPEAGNECKSDHCVDGVCCDTACDIECQACNLEGTEGACTGHPLDTDPENDCVLCEVCSGSSTCIFSVDGTDPTNDCEDSSPDVDPKCQQDGQCDGAGECRLWLPGTVCLAQYCVVKTLHPADTCNGTGTCADNGTQECTPYACNEGGSACRTFCEEDAHCYDDHWCNPSQECVPKKENGELCNGQNECLSDFCVDGYCCENACDDICLSCALEGTEGACTPHPVQTDPEDNCPTCQVCSGAGAECVNVPVDFDPVDDCLQGPKGDCQLNGDCDGSGACELWEPGTICLAQYCADHLEHQDDTCDGVGVCDDNGIVDCTPYQCADDDINCRTDCITDIHCVTTHWCDNFVAADFTCKAKFDNGDECIQGNQCKSSYCVDGFCCESPCEGDCRSCSQPGNEGSCTYHANDSDPEDDCTLCRVCNGGGECKFAGEGTDPISECAQTDPKVPDQCEQDGTCDGAGACRLWLSGTVCVDQTCEGHTLYPDDLCDGVGECPDSGEQPCDPYNCNDLGNDCRTSCFVDEHCIVGYWCNPINQCVEKKDNGEMCGGGNECKSDFCVDGYCCDTACDMNCEACNIEGLLGECSYHSTYTDPEFECPPCRLCDGNGECMNVNNGEDAKEDCVQDGVDTCDQDGWCDGTGLCRLWNASTICVAQSCVGFLEYPTDYCDGVGDCVDSGEVDCVPYVCAADAVNCLTYCEGTNDDMCQAIYYCLADECVPKKDNGETCTEGRECLSDYCIDGYCCDTACDEICEACNKPGVEGTCTVHEADTDPEDNCAECQACSGIDTTCVMVAVATDPVNDCGETSASECGLDGTCDGAGACRLWIDGTVCLEQYCSQFFVYWQDKCDGLGTCVDGGEEGCYPYACDDAGFACRTFCEIDAHCHNTFWCNANQECEMKKDNGDGCTGANQCKSNFCVDGFCCDTACDGECQRCDMDGLFGVCSYATNNTDPDLECGHCSVCNGAGTCKASENGTDPLNDCIPNDVETCDLDGYCDGAYQCRYWNTATECLAQTCAGHIKDPTHYCDGVGDCVNPADVDCEPYVCNGDGTDCLFSCQSDADCMPLFYCLGAVCVPKKPTGDPCGAANECLSNFCVDGYCCESACAETCSSCALEGEEGSCGTYAVDTDPELECGLCNVCTGDAACKVVLDGDDPLNQCLADPVSTCDQDGVCDGESACRNWLPGSICIEQYCDFHVVNVPDECDGSGSCLDLGTIDCSPYECADDDTNCRTSCSVDDHCIPLYWCDAPTCVPKKVLGETCNGANECLSNLCVDGYCCNSPCEETCESCAIAGTEGTCTTHAQGSDPEDECALCQACIGDGHECVLVLDGVDPVGDCTADSAASCDQDGTCDGAGACRLWLEETECLAQFCVNGVEHAADLCDGVGECLDKGTTNCPPYVCDDAAFACLTLCVDNDDCVSTHWCDVPNCVPKKDIGELCAADAECISAHCVDGYCCNTACDGNCESCAIVDVEGICTFFANDTDSEDDCGQCMLCNGAGLCKNVLDGMDPYNDCPQFDESTCQGDGYCDGSGGCDFWADTTICDAQSCVGSTLYPADYCDGGGACVESATESCCPYMCWNNGCLNSCFNNDHCCTGNYCSGAECVGKKPEGETCIQGYECLSGFCIDGYCCNEECGGDCRSCAVAGKEGTCTSYAANTDPQAECGLCRVCNGAGSCKFVEEGEDYKTECWQTMPWSCGQDGTCDGAGHCDVWDDTTVCANQVCQWTTLYPADYCSGDGVCTDSPSASCCPYACNAQASGCRDACALDWHCCPDAYCNAGGCTAKKDNGEVCNGHSECLSNYCIDGFCCDTPCTQLCESCNQAGLEGTCTFTPTDTDPENNCSPCLVCSGADNTCVPAADNTDPANDCAAHAQSSCGYSGMCNGTGQCDFWDAGVECFPQYCVGGYVFYADQCNGMGLCTDGGYASCSGYTCDAEGLDCKSSCDEDGDCLFGYYCAADSTCQPKKGNGEDCAKSTECLSWYCVDGVCCNGPCAGQCQKCNEAGWEGICFNIANNSDPEAECGVCRVCSGGGFCKNAASGGDPKEDCTQLEAWTCSFDGQCNGVGGCQYWDATTTCQDQFCTESTLYLADTCNGLGTCLDAGNITCAPYKCADDESCLTSCADDADCVSGFYCLGSVCVPKKATGSPCGSAVECLSGNCVDGYCCNSGCAGECRACNLAGHEGVCTYHAPGDDPETECGLCKVCNGTGSCGNADEGADPKDDCVSTDPSTCGADGVCNGSGQCRKWPGGTNCNEQACAASALTPTKFCDGNGACVGTGSGCEVLGWEDLFGSGLVCSESDPCSGPVLYEQAVNMCSAWGGRLCTYDELADRESQGTGCGYDAERVWTISECGEDAFWTGPGNPDNIGAIPKSCTDATDTAYVRCCADNFSCCPYMCQGNGCGTMCGGNDDCCDGYFCQAGVCELQEDLGDPCQGPEQCPSGFCVDGYCCDTACEGLCEACNLPGQEGTCSAQPNNTDPENDCATCQVCNGSKACKLAVNGTDPGNDCVQQAQASCAYDGQCAGDGTCRFWPDGTKCSNIVCSDHTYYDADECDGAGVCEPANNSDCCPYRCNVTGTECRNSCSSNGHCCSDAYCEAGTCVGKLSNGAGCNAPQECLSGFCTDGVCCDGSCSGDCQACNLAGNVGNCTPYDNNSDPEGECGKCNVCNGAFACKSVNAGSDPKNDCGASAASSCGWNGMCDGAGACQYWSNATQCESSECGGTTFYPTEYCDGAGLCVEAGAEDCCPYKCGTESVCLNSCTSDVSCCDGYHCVGSACVPKKANGESCSSNSECFSQKCVDGYCCDDWCAGQCQACNVGGKLGTCTFYGAQTDPTGECGLCRFCDGAGACVNVDAQTDPLNACTQSDQATCKLNGLCDGGGACQYWQSDTVCQEQTCSNNVEYVTQYCNGSGNCISLPEGSTSCCPYACGSGNTCRANCTDNSHCCGGYFCISGQCLSKKPNGSACAAGDECESGFCVDGFCCNNACENTCQACNVENKVGFCTFLSTNTDPDNECGVCKVCNGFGACVNVADGSDALDDCLAQSPCGQDGQCDGSGSCRLWDAGTECNPKICSGSTQYLADYCDGDGLCEDSGSTSCSPYKCSGNDCATNCATDGDCVVGYYCSASVCVPKKSLGEGCGGNNQCLSGYCVDGVCCDGPCTGVCRACNSPVSLGACAYISNNTDLNGECGKCQVCNGAGACKMTPAGQDAKDECIESVSTTCGDDGGCDGSGQCRKWPASIECGTPSCVGETLEGTDYCSGTGACVDSGSSTCCPYKCGTDACLTSCASDANCCATSYCNGSACVDKKANGEACSGAIECASGLCVDGFCCNSTCTGTCQACNVSGKEGTCSPHPSGDDPGNECPNCQACNGAGACSAVAAGTDPGGDCSQTDSDTCGQSGNCDGSGNCSMWPNSTICTPQSCLGNMLHLADKCDGLGVCVDAGSSSCCPYACSGDSCRSNCSDTSHCCTGFWCQGGQCKAKKGIGESCTSASECASGFCVDGVCCNNACTGGCKACNLAGFVGNCTFHSYLTDPDDECGVCSICDGAGACVNANSGTDPFNDCGQQDMSTCGNDGTCNGSGACRKWGADVICHTQTCDNNAFQPTDYCNGAGSCLDSGSVSCCPFSCLGDQCRSSCTADQNCCPTAICKSNTQCQNCSTSSPCAKGQYCCYGDTCSPYIEAHSPPANTASSSNVNSADATYYGSTFGASNQFLWSTGNSGGQYGRDRVYHIHTKSDSVGVDLQIKVWGNFDTLLYVKQVHCGGDGVKIWYNDDGCNLGKGSCLHNKMLPGKDWYVYVDGFGTQKGDYTIQFDWTTLCGNCACDSTYGENQTNNPVECYESGDYCGNFIQTNFTTHPQTKYFYDNLAGDHDDFSPYGSWAWGNCWFCNYCKPHGHYDKIYRFNLPWTVYVSIYYNKHGGWSPNNYPRMMIYKGADFCKNGNGQKMLCRYSTNNEQSWGWSWSSPKTWSAGTYWIVTDMYYEQAVYTAPYRLIIKTWNASSGHLSDIRLKTDIRPLPGSKYEVLGLQGVQYTWNEAALEHGLRGEDRGLIAQEVEALYPWAVGHTPDGLLTVDYEALDSLVEYVERHGFLPH